MLEEGVFERWVRASHVPVYIVAASLPEVCPAFGIGIFPVLGEELGDDGCGGGGGCHVGFEMLLSFFRRDSSSRNSIQKFAGASEVFYIEFGLNVHFASCRILSCGVGTAVAG